MSEAETTRWLTYAELGELLGITPTAARMLAKRRGWQRRTPNAYGDRARVLVTAKPDVQPRTPIARGTFADRMITTPNDQERVNEHPLEQAIAALSKALAGERARVDRLLAELADARAAVRDLVDARAAAEISRNLAASLQRELDSLRARRPWWRRWFR